MKAGSTGSMDSRGQGKASVKEEPSQPEDVVEEKPKSPPSARKPQHPQKQKQESQTADSDDDDSAPVITGYFPSNRHMYCTIHTIVTSAWTL